MAKFEKSLRRWMDNRKPLEVSSMLFSRDRSCVFPADEKGRWGT